VGQSSNSSLIAGRIVLGIIITLINDTIYTHIQLSTHRSVVKYFSKSIKMLLKKGYFLEVPVLKALKSNTNFQNLNNCFNFLFFYEIKIKIEN